MPKIKAKFLEPYINNGYRHQFYIDSVKYYDELSVHANGIYPKELIDERRPAESNEIKNYRKKIFVPITKPPFNKIFNSLQKIRKSQDWALIFNKDLPTKIIKDESPEIYLTKKFPRNTSITNWFFNVGLKNYLIDSGAVVFTFPIDVNIKPNEYYKPYPRIFNSDNIIDYKHNKYYVLRDTERSQYKENDVTYNDGELYWVVQPDVIQIFEKRRSGIYEIFVFQNKLNYMPIRHMYGLIKKEGKDNNLYESRLNGIVPKLNEALREYSDLQAEIVQHIHSTMWAIQQQQCGRCKGVGEIPKENSAPIRCPGCDGKGLMPLNPYEHLVLAYPRPGDNNIPTPPIGYVQKQTDIARLQEERIRQHIYDALSSINMEFLAESPLAQSGVAKQVDREELYSFVHSVAEDIVRIIDEICVDICSWRYLDIVNDVYELVPDILVPQKYDLLSEAVLIDELSKMVQSKVDPAIINAAQIEIAAKKFNDTSIKDLVLLKLKLDPFAGVPEESISLQKTFNAVKQNDLIIHSNINQFVTKAINTIDGFADMNYEEQMQIMNDFAIEMFSEQSQQTPIEPENVK